MVFAALPEAKSAIWVIVAHPNSWVVSLHADAGTAPIKMDIDDCDGSVSLIGGDLFKLLR